MFDFQDTATTPTHAATTLLQAVTNSVTDHDLVPEREPAHSLPPQFSRELLDRIELVQTLDGWIGNIVFNMPVGEPDVIRTSQALIFHTRAMAFTHAAAIVIEIMTGIRELPYAYADMSPCYRTT